MSIKEYAERLDVKKQAIMYRIKEKKELPGVVSKRKHSTGWLFIVDLSISAKDAKKYFRKK